MLIRAKDDTQVCKDLVLHDSPGHNSFRDLLLLSGDHAVLQHVIVANSALHYANAMRNGQKASDIQQELSGKAHRDALVAKHRALRLLSEALANANLIYPDVVLASIMLFIMLELLESGTSEWRFHIEGARQLMGYLRQNGKLESPTLSNLRDCLLHNCIV